MPFALAIIGIVFLTAGVRGTSEELLTLLTGDLVDGNFIYWILSIAIIGSVGYVDALRPLSRSFLVLIILVLVLAEDKSSTSGGLFDKFQGAIEEISGKAGAQ